MNQHDLNDFNKLVDDLKSKYISLWKVTKADFPVFDNKIKFLAKFINKWRIERFRKGLHKTISQVPKNEHEREIISHRIFSLVEELENKIIGYEDGLLNYFLSHGYSDITKDFIEKVKSFDATMGVYDIFQAIRNVWIMNSIQIIFNVKVKLTPSIFSYSMLYPYSDNFLDDPSVDAKDKKEFNNRFKKCLCGQDVEAFNYLEECIFQLVHNIENDYRREIYPQVFQSLIAIHSAQEKSILQQRIESFPVEKDLLGISCEKGGTSVLADGYLIKGNLSEKEADFVFGYGVLLQLIDDLQDVEEDLNKGHMTIFSQAAKLGSLDKLTNKLFWFKKEILNKADIFLSDDSLKLKKIIHVSCIIMIIEAISKNQKMFSKEYLKKIEEYSLVKLSYFKKLKRKFQKQYSQHDLNNIFISFAYNNLA